MKSKKSILFVTPHFPPSQSVGTQRIAKFIKYLKQNGWEVHVLTLKKKYYQGRTIIDYQFFLPDSIHVVRTGKIDVFLWWDRLKRKFTSHRNTLGDFGSDGSTSVSSSWKAPVKKKASRIIRVKEFITRMMQYPDRDNGWTFNVLIHAFKLIRRYKIPYVFLSSPPHSQYIALNILHRFLNFIYIIDFRDPWARSQWSKQVHNFYEKTARTLDLHYEGITLKKADIMIFNNEFLQQEYLNCYPNSGIIKKSIVLTNGFDPQLVNAKQLLRPRTTRGAKDIVIIHTGTLYKKRNPIKIFKAFLKFREIHPKTSRRIHFKFVGHITPDLKYLYDYVHQQDLEDQIKFFPSQPYDVAIQQMTNADWLLILQPITRIQVPAKFFDYLTVPRPIIGVVESESISENLIQRLEVGLVSYNDSEASLMNFFSFITQTPHPEFKPNPQEMEHFMMPNIVKRFVSILPDR